MVSSRGNAILFFFPYIVYFLKKKFNRNFIKKILSVIIILGLIFTLYYSNNINLTFYSPIFRFWEFLLGSLSYYIQTENKSSKNEDKSFMLLTFFL
jgi:peptidoglycan/LPS O-acetylase OafA/YrhL